MTILVAGAAGFIGSHLAQSLLQTGEQVVGIDNINDAYDTRLKEWRLAQLDAHDRFTFEHVDITKPDAVTELIAKRKPEAIYNLAARAGVRQSMADPWVYVDTNVTGTLNLLEACRTHDVDRILLASTSSLYGSHNERPFRETADTSRPLSPYAASKKGAESMSAAYHHLYGIKTPIVRYFTVYGPAGRPDMSVFRFIKWIDEGHPITLYGDGTQERDFTYVEDIVAGTQTVMAHAAGPEVYNLGGDQPHTINHLIHTIEDAVGKEAMISRHPSHPADVQATWADITKAREIGWAPKIPLEQGIERTVAWHREAGSELGRIDVGA